MRIRVFTPLQIMIDEPAEKITAEAENGAFSLLPRHIDFAASLSTSIFSFIAENGEEKFLAVDGGILVKRGSDISVASRNVVIGDDLGYLRNAIDEEFKNLDEHEKKSRSALAMLEGSILKEINRHGRL